MLRALGWGSALAVAAVAVSLAALTRPEVRDLIPGRVSPQRACVVPSALPLVTPALGLPAWLSASRLWGTFRPGTYFSLRPRLPSAPVVGALWTDPARRDWWRVLRHDVRPDDGVGFTWAFHDGFRSGAQRIADGRFLVTTSFTKRHCGLVEAGAGRADAARASGKLDPSSPPPATSDMHFWRSLAERSCGLGGDWGAKLRFETLTAEARADMGNPEVPVTPADAPLVASVFFYVFDDGGYPVHLDLDAFRKDLEAIAAFDRGVAERKAKRARKAGACPKTEGSGAERAGGEEEEGEEGDDDDGDDAGRQGAGTGAGATRGKKRRDAGSRCFPRAPPDAVLSGRSRSLGPFSLAVRARGRAGFPIGVHSLGLQRDSLAKLPDDVRGGVMRSLREQRAAGATSYSMKLPDDAEPDSNLAVVQLLIFAPAEVELTWIAQQAPKRAERTPGGARKGVDLGVFGGRVPGPPLGVDLEQGIESDSWGRPIEAYLERSRRGTGEASTSAPYGSFAAQDLLWMARRDALAGWSLTDALAVADAAFKSRAHAAFGLGPAHGSAAELLSSAVGDMGASHADALAEAGLADVRASGKAGEDASQRNPLAPHDGVAHPGIPELRASTARSAVANLLGGLSYASGALLTRLPCAPETSTGELAVGAPADPSLALGPEGSLFSATPGRANFAHGFLWDEGFHMLVLRRWDPSLAREVLASWLDTQLASGWIPREQIRGPEARARVPDEFIPQDPAVANPPSLFLPVEEMAVAAEADPGGPDAAFLRAAWPRLAAWHAWLARSQRGELPGSFRWRGRDAGAVERNPKTLASGLDDFPRASHPTKDERHVDLYCWVALASRTLARAGRALGVAARELEPIERLSRQLHNVTLLDELHLDASVGLYRDWGLHSSDVALVHDRTTGQTTRRARTPPRLSFVPEDGYVGLFPFALRLLPPSHAVVGASLELMADPARLASPAGVRSLSRLAPHYEAWNTKHDPPYWRGTVWVNVNALLVRACDWYAAQPGPFARRAADVGADLRIKLLETIEDEHSRTGFFWEQYNDTTAQGRGAKPFTGWTALYALLAGDA